MKKIALSLAGVLAAAAFAPEASALPAFARQTGMACTACHFQKFPVLNGFGRAFKAAGYTMMGAQEKVEAEHLSIPATLNAAILIKYRYQKDNGPKVLGAGTTAAPGTGDGQWQMGDEASLFFGGRVAENIGFLLEGNLANHTTVGGGTPTLPGANQLGGTGGLLAGLRIPITFDVGGAKLSAIPFTTDALGVAYGYELSSGGIMRANRWAEHRRETSAVQYVGLDLPATGFAFVAQNDMGFINLTKWSPSFAPGANGGAVPSTNYKNNYIRIAATPTVGDWALLVGAGSMSGSSFSNVNVAQMDSRATFFDVQAQGEVAGKELALYLQNASAPGTAVGGIVNVYNGRANTRKAWTLGADYSVIPHTLHIGAAYRNGKTGGAVGADGDNAWTVTAVYDLVQNVALHANYSAYSGSSRNATIANPTPVKNLYTLMLEAAW